MAEFKSAHQALLDWARLSPDRPFLHQPVGDKVDTYSWSQCADISLRLASALRGLGLERGDKVALLSKNCAEWFLSDIAIAMADLVSVPIYPTAGKKTIAQVLEHSEAKAIIIGKLDDPEVPVGAMPDGIRTISMPYTSIDCEYEWQSLLDNSVPLQDIKNANPDDVMTILYTSGSTGHPKGVVLTYAAYHYSSNAAMESLGGSTGEAINGYADDRLFSYLPLAHITERACTEGPAVYAGCQCFFVDSMETFKRDLRNARATVFISVPRLWVQFQSAVHAEISPAKLSIMLRIPFLGKAVAGKIRDGLGLSHAHTVGSGSAPISPSTLKWYQRIGVNIGEGWGMSETCGLSCGNTPFDANRIGTIGVPMPGTEMKLSDENEILIRAPGLFREYYKDPELTKEAFTEDGFFRTGDKGEWDEQSQAFRITGRVKDLFKSAKGKYIVPVPIESKLSGNPMLEQICVMGSGLRAPVAVVVLAPAARELEKAQVIASVSETLDRVNERLESHEKLDRIVIANDEWTIENELLTPTMKIKRELLENRYRHLIAENHTASVVWE